MSSGEANEIQYRNIASLWRALGKTGPAPRPAMFEEAVRVYYDLAGQYAAKYGGKYGRQAKR